MLTITGVKNPSSGEISVSHHVLFSFRSGEDIRVNPITWRYKDGRDGLLEFKIDRTSGELYGVTLVNSRQRLENRNDLPCEILGGEPGLPVVNAYAVKGSVFDEPITVSLVRSIYSLGALWGDWGSSTRCLHVGRTRFLLREDELLGVCFVSLTDDEMATAEEWDTSR